MENNPNRSHILIWVGIVAIIGVGLIWYAATHPAPAVSPALTSSSTPEKTVSAPKSIHDDEQYFTVDAEYPTLTPLAKTASLDADARARSQMSDYVMNTIADFKHENIDSLSQSLIDTMQLGQDGRKYSLNMSYEGTSSPATVSFVYTIFLDTMGAHPNTTYKTFTFDSKTGDALSISDLFVPGSDYLNILSSTTRADLTTMLGDNSGPQFIDPGTEPSDDNFSTFTIANGSLNIIFPPYQVGPYVLGTVVDPIPLSKLSTILKPEYRSN